MPENPELPLPGNGLGAGKNRRGRWGLLGGSPCWEQAAPGLNGGVGYFLSAQGAGPSPLPVPVGDPGVVVEDGPVVYDDAAADDEDEEDEEACVSAMDLLGSHGQSPLPVSAQNGRGQRSKV